MIADSPKVTVIVPFLNAESTLERCARSVLSQTLEELEVVFVNDGSHDRSVDVVNAVLADYPSRAANVKFLDFPIRQGLYHANHAAILKSTGRYLIRCDADDEFASPDVLRLMVEAAERASAEIVAAPYFLVKGEKRSLMGLPKSFPDINAMKINTAGYALWNKLISRSLLVDNSIFPFANVDCWEDLVLVARALVLTDKIVAVDLPVYNYYLNPGARSLSRASRSTLLHQHLLAALLLEQWFAKEIPDNRYERFLTRLKFISKVKFLRGKYKDVGAWKKTFPEVNNRVLSITGVPIIYRLMYGVVVVMPTRLCQWIADRCNIFYSEVNKI